MYRLHSSRLLGAAVISTLTAAHGVSYADDDLPPEVIVTASLGKNLLDVAQPVTVLGGDDLSRRLAGSLGETLSGQLGVSSTYFGPTASRPVIRGLSGYRVQSLQDGLSTLDVGNLSDDHATTIDPSLAEQIEIIKGPATLLYGSGAAGGLVNVVTNRIPTVTPADGFDGMLETRGGTVADERSGVLALHAGSQHISVRADAFGAESKAIRIPGPATSARLRDRLAATGETPETSVGVMSNAFSESQGGAVGASFLSDDALIGGSMSRYETTYGIPSENDAFIDMQQDRYEAKFEWRRNVGWLRSLQLIGAYNDYAHTEFEAPDEPATLFKQNAFDTRFTVGHAHRDNWRGTFGVQATQIDFVAEGDEAFVPPSKTAATGVFALEEFDYRRWTLSVGARFERQSVQPGGVALSQAAFVKVRHSAVSIAGSATLKLGDTDTVAINLSHSARQPQATELFARGPHLATQRFEIGDATLDTENANTIDIGLRRHTDGFGWHINVFYNDYRDFVFASPVGEIEDGLPVVQYRQSGAALYGYEAEVWAPLYRQHDTSLRLRLLSDYVRGKRDNGESLPQMPPLRFGAGLHFDRKAWRVELEALRHTAQNRVAMDELPTDAYLMLNADISYAVVGKADGFVFVRGTNLLNEEARQHTSPIKDLAPLPGRSLHAGVRLAF